MDWLPLIVVLLLIPLACAAQGPSFYASFDRWTVADVASGGRAPIKQIGGEISKVKRGSALKLDGNSYVEFPAGANIPGNAFTICLWVRPDDWGAKTYDNILGLSDTDNNALHLERSHPGGQLRITLGGPESTGGAMTRSIFSKAPLVNGEWVHVAVVIDKPNRVASLYVNGELQVTLEQAEYLPENPASILVGCGFGRLSRAVAGLIDELVILPYPASAEEIRLAMTDEQLGANAPALENRALVALLDASGGQVTVGSAAGAMPQIILGPLAPWVEADGHAVTWPGFQPPEDLPPAAGRLGPGKHLAMTSREDAGGLALRYHVQVQDDLPVVCLWAEITNRTDTAIKVGRICVAGTADQGGLTLTEPLEGDRVFLDTGGLMNSGSHALNQPDAHHAAHGAFVLAKPERAWAASVSFVTFQTGAVTTSLHTDATGAPRSLQAVCDYPNGYLLQPGATLASEVLAVGIYPDGHAALAGWADTVMAANELDPPRHCPSGWNSWYAYRLTITEDLMLENARIMQERFAPLGATNMQIDHGWQDRDIVGNWVPNDRFPRGLNWLAEQLEAMGLSLGLWTAVSQVSEFAPLYTERPDLLFRDAEGKPFVADPHWFWVPHGKTFTLDPTSPEGEERYRDMGRAVKGYGCKYLKNDFQGNLLNPTPTPADAGMTRGAPIYRKAMQAFREAMGPEMAYHACNAPLNIAAGMCDVAWVHGDLGNPGARWDWLRQFARDLACRLHVSGKFYWSDPDYLQVGQGQMNETRVRMVFTVLGGGPAFICDRLPELPEERLALIPQCLPSYRTPATPIDLFDRDEYPQVWSLPVVTAWGNWHVVGLLNLDEQEARIGLDLSRLGLESGKTYLIYDFFEGKLLGEVPFTDDLEISVRVPMPATDARVLRITEKLDRPFVLSTDMHLTQGGVELLEVAWDAETLSLSGTAVRAPGIEGKVFVYVPEGYAPADGGEAMSGRILAVPVQFAQREAAWSVRFVRE